MNTIATGRTPATFEALTVADTAVGITAAIKKPTSGVYVGKLAEFAFFGPLETAQIRWRCDGGDPTAAVGHLLEIGQTITLDNPIAIANFRAIRTGGSSGTLPVFCAF